MHALRFERVILLTRRSPQEAGTTEDTKVTESPAHRSLLPAHLLQLELTVDISTPQRALDFGFIGASS